MGRWPMLLPVEEARRMDVLCAVPVTGGSREVSEVGPYSEDENNGRKTAILRSVNASPTLNGMVFAFAARYPPLPVTRPPCCVSQTQWPNHDARTIHGNSLLYLRTQRKEKQWSQVLGRLRGDLGGASRNHLVSWRARGVARVWVVD